MPHFVLSRSPDSLKLDLGELTTSHLRSIVFWNYHDIQNRLFFVQI